MNISTTTESGRFFLIKKLITIADMEKYEIKNHSMPQLVRCESLPALLIKWPLIVHARCRYNDEMAQTVLSYTKMGRTKTSRVLHF